MNYIEELSSTRTTIATAATGVVFYTPLNKILLGKRRNVPFAVYPGLWCFPGGFQEIGKERLIDTVSREVEEECKILIPSERWYLFYMDDVPGADPRYAHVINACFKADATHDDFIAAGPSDELEEVDWFSLHEAIRLDLAFNHSTILKEFIIQDGWEFY